MKAGQRVVVTNTLHAYYGNGGVISTVSKDEEGTVMLVTLDNKKQVMVEPSDIMVTR